MPPKYYRPVHRRTLRRSGEFPMVIHMITIGKNRRTFGHAFNVAQSYEGKSILGRSMTSLIEPAYDILMGGMVGFVVFS